MNTNNITVNGKYEIQCFRHKWANGILVKVVGINLKTGKFKCVRDDLATQKFELSKNNLKMIA